MGVPLHWWSPWNEPNDATFLSPQRERCEAGAAPVAPAVYARLARAMAAQLRLSDPAAALVLGELNGLTRDSPRATSLQSFVAALPGGRPLPGLGLVGPRLCPLSHRLRPRRRLG